MNKTMRFLAVAATVAFSITSTMASDSAEQLYNSALTKYAARGDGSPLQNINEAITLLGQAAAMPDAAPALKYNILILASRANFFKGGKMEKKEDRLAFFQAGMDRALEARKVNAEPAESYYYYTINLGQWAQTTGVLESLGRKEELKREVREAATRKTLAGADGKTQDGMGPMRVIGRMEFMLRQIGGDMSKSVQYLTAALAGAPGFAINTWYLAETLSKMDADSKAKARAMLEELLKKAPTDPAFDQSRVPETADELRKAAEVLKGM